MQRIRLLIVLLTAVVLGTAVTAGSASPRGNVLPDATYNLIVQVNAEFEDLDALTASEISAKQYVAEAGKICRNYPTDDPLLRTARERCLESVNADRLTQQLMATPLACKTKRSCMRVVRRIETSSERWYRLAVQFNRIASETLPAGQCLTALTYSSDELRYYRQSGRLTTADMRAWLNDDKRARKAIARRIKDLRKMNVRSTAQRNKDIVAHC
jgi:hypothetical protein